MIDTDKYEGHEFLNDENIEHYELTDVDYQMLREAPLLLAEVKRLREKNEKLHSRCMHLENLLEEWQGAYE